MRRFEELDWQSTPIGEISLRRRREPALDVDVYEVRLDEDFLMSSLFTVAEVALADLGLAAARGDALDVVVGGLGLGCTARAALADQRVRSLVVVEALPAVIGWHVRELLPLGADLNADPRCSLVEGDFFARVAAGEPFPPQEVDVVLLDVDHSPRHVLHPSHAPFYEVAGLQRLRERLRPGGVFALWSDDPPDDDFLERAGRVFAAAEAVVVPFANHLTGGTSSNTVYVCTLDTDTP